jgi:hypothetical protein
VKKDQHTFLHAYVKCMIPEIEVVSHCLPCSVVMEILTKNNTTLRLHENKVIFEAFPKAIGGPIAEPGITWEDVKSGKSNIVIDDHIDIITKIRLLDSKEGCMIVNNNN